MNGKIFLYIISSLLLVGLISVAVYFILKPNLLGQGKRWKCDPTTLTCLQNGEAGAYGAYTDKSECEKGCPMLMDKYSCDKNECVKDANGKYFGIDACNSECVGGGVGGGKTWKCNNLIPPSCEQTGHTGEQNTWPSKAGCSLQCN